MRVHQTTIASTGEAAARAAGEAAAVSSSRRALGVDVARALALIGMIAVHGFPEENAEGGLSLVYGLAGGRASALFAVLAGVSIAFVEKRSRGQLHGRTLAADRAALAVRGLLILLVGLLLGHVNAVETIIPYFGVLFLFVLPFYGRSSRVLLIWAALLAVFGAILRHLLNGWVPEEADPGADYTVLTAAQQPVPFTADMLVTGHYPVILWMVYLCVGLVIGRQVLTSRRLALQLVGYGAALAVAAWSASKLLLGPVGGMQRLIEATPSMTGDEIAEVLLSGPEAVLMPNTTWWWLTAVSPYSETPFTVLHNLGAAVAVLGLTLLVTHHGGKVFTPFAAMGAMTLTLYSAHVILLMLEVLDEDRPVVSLWIQIIAFMLFALAWRRVMGRGPLEAIISEASDWTRQWVREARSIPSSDSAERARTRQPSRTADPTRQPSPSGGHPTASRRPPEGTAR